MASSLKKVIISTMVGNGLEWYDYLLYGNFAVLISTNFFPKTDPVASLIATYGIFASGFLMRPLGAMFFGYIGDKYGRKNALALSILLMSIPTALIGLLPTYESIGILAPVLLVVVRLVQGVAVGGEFGGSIVYLVEHSKENNRNLLGSASIISMLIGVLFGALISALLANIMSKEDFENFGWRIPFLLGFVIGLVGLYIRTNLKESPEFFDAKEAGHVCDKPIKETFQRNWKEIILAIGVYLAVTVPFYIQVVFMNSFMIKFLNFSVSDALTIFSIILVIMTIVTPISAKLCDKYDRENILRVVLVAYILFAFPYVYLLTTGEFYSVLFAQTIFALILAFYLAPIPALLVDIFPTRTRCTGMSLACNLSAAIFGGTVPMALAWMIPNMGNNYSIAYYVLIASVLSLICVSKVRTRFHYSI